ncbi:MAG TPA: hypothetical protein EYO92_05115 [Candidatus Marinimicrobia bacterium]|nr:hypothetical protein [Candidatus Neomarinimicrobiota bacterium]
MNRSSFGYTIRFVEEYVLRHNLFTLEEAIRKMTSLPATSAGLSNRGCIQAGKAADLVVLDLDRLSDNSTDQAPQAYPSGVEIVVVNGEVVLDHGHRADKLPGGLA